MSIKGNPKCPVNNNEVESSETLPVKQEIDAFTLKEDDEKNVSELQSHYVERQELQFNQKMQDVDFFGQEFNDPVLNYTETNYSLIEESVEDPTYEIHARTNIQSAENLIESEWPYNIRVGEPDYSSDPDQITTEDSDSEASNSEYYSCEEEDGSNKVLSKFSEVENVLNLLHEVAQSPAVQSFADFVPECVVPFCDSELVRGTVLVDEGVLMKEDKNVGKSKLCKETSPSFDTEATLPIDLSSTSHIETYDKFIPECDFKHCALWSILVDIVSYHEEENSSSFQTEALYKDQPKTYYRNPKDLYFNADNNNVPNLNTCNKSKKGEFGNYASNPQFLNSQVKDRHYVSSQRQYFMAANCNEPKLSMKCCEDNSKQFGLTNYVTVTYLWNDRSVNPSTRGILLMFRWNGMKQSKLVESEQTKLHC